MKVLVASLFLSVLLVGALANDVDVECEGFDTYAMCPGGWPFISATEAKHRVFCCGNAEKGICPRCNRCVPGSFSSGCCDCDDNELVDHFWSLMHQAHVNENTQADNAGITERDFIDLIAQVRGEMDATEELKVKDIYEAVLAHWVPAGQKTTSGMLQMKPLIDFLRSYPDYVDHILGEGEAPAEGAHQLALDHTKAVTPEWHSGVGTSAFGDHLAPPILRKQHGLWMVLVPNCKHPENGYYPAVTRHSHQEAVAYIASKKAECLSQEAKQEQRTHDIRAKAGENVRMVHHDRRNAGYKKYNDMTNSEKDRELTGDDYQANGDWNSHTSGGNERLTLIDMKQRMKRHHN